MLFVFRPRSVFHAEASTGNCQQQVQERASLAAVDEVLEQIECSRILPGFDAVSVAVAHRHELAGDLTSQCSPSSLDDPKTYLHADALDLRLGSQALSPSACEAASLRRAA